MEVIIYEDIPKCDFIFVGGAFTKLALYLRTNITSLIIANGGFVGSNLVNNPLDKFKGKEFMRTYNFNLDVNSTISVLNSNNYDKLYLIGKNVCHNKRNTIRSIWKETEFINKYQLNENKKLHDLLMAQEGLKIINGQIEQSLLNFININCINNGLNGNMTNWGSIEGNRVIAALDWK